METHTEFNTRVVPLSGLSQATIRPGFIGFLISLSLCGAGIAQTIFYYRSFPRDGRMKKAVVLLLNIADLSQTVLISHLFWEMLIKRRFSREDPITPPWQIDTAFAIMTGIMMVVQGFFALRVWKVSRGNRTLIVAFAFPPLMSIVAVIFAATHNNPSKDQSIYNEGSVGNIIISVQFAGAFMSDSTVAGSLMYYFNSHRVGMPRTEPVMQQLIWLSMSTGLLLCLMSGLAWALYEYDREGGSMFAPLFIFAKLYLNSMMANLNSRRHFRAVVERTMDYSINIETIQLATHY